MYGAGPRGSGFFFFLRAKMANLKNLHQKRPSCGRPRRRITVERRGKRGSRGKARGKGKERGTGD